MRTKRVAAATVERKQATCHPARWTALITAPPDEKSAAAASTSRRAARGVELGERSMDSVPGGRSYAKPGRWTDAMNRARQLSAEVVGAQFIAPIIAPIIAPVRHYARPPC